MLPHEHWSFSVHFSLTAAYAALRLKWRGKCVNSLSMCGCRPLAAGFHKCLAYVGAALRLSGGETVKIDIGRQRGCGWSQIFLVCLGGRVLPCTVCPERSPPLSEREKKRKSVSNPKNVFWNAHAPAFLHPVSALFPSHFWRFGLHSHDLPPQSLLLMVENTLHLQNKCTDKIRICFIYSEINNYLCVCVCVCVCDTFHSLQSHVCDSFIFFEWILWQ